MTVLVGLPLRTMHFDKLTTSYVAPMAYTWQNARSEAGWKDRQRRTNSKKEETKENGDQDGTNWKKNVRFAYLELKSILKGRKILY